MIRTFGPMLAGLAGFLFTAILLLVPGQTGFGAVRRPWTVCGGRYCIAPAILNYGSASSKGTAGRRARL